MSINQVVTDFATLAIKNDGFMEMDRLYIQNRVLALIGTKYFVPCVPRENLPSANALVEKLVEEALENKLIENQSKDKEVLSSKLMDLLTPPTSVINALFSKIYTKSPEDATHYFYHLCCQNASVKSVTESVAPIEWKQDNAYPKCPVCFTNEGYIGNEQLPAKVQHRMIRMNLEGSSWGFYYKEHPQFLEHCLFVAEKHQPLDMKQKTLDQLLQIVEIFPHYFAGAFAFSENPNPKSSLSHAHFEGGKRGLPIEKTTFETLFSLKKYPKIIAGILKWPVSAVRMQGENRKELASALMLLLKKCHKQKLIVLPVARKNHNFFEVDCFILKACDNLELPIYYQDKQWLLRNPCEIDEAKHISAFDQSTQGKVQFKAFCESL
ncbi:hypothetical protein ACFFIF_05575 [Vagococcus entomophilus]|uniref:Galactose-1-phosphate uridyl transferase N-terminal domain-containing protein n=1 Tax=Vagococcus entomophilus TaxID=1160095 RepID=A0A430AIL5_9ENTE|nr:hypothetical protein [Vagococcus entomophilus]RSU07757.1 hypothetical protein CBF30_00515 [Vagococcus entomophilus]